MNLRIKEARERAGLSQTELASRIGVAPNTFNGYEKGNHDPKTSLLIKIALECKTSMDYLLGQTNDPTPVYTKKAPASEGEGAKENVSLEETNAVLVEMGYIRQGEQLSDADFAFLKHIGGLMDAWFSSKHP